MILGVGIGLSFGRGVVSQTNRLLALLRSGASQLIMHPLEYGSMFQDRAGTIPVTESGQLVGMCLDAGPGGYHATAISDSARGIFRDVGGKRWIEYNGVNTAYQTPVLPAPGVDKAQVFAGLRKLSDAGTGILAELGTTGVQNGIFNVAAPINVGSTYRFVSRGDVMQAATVTGFFAPDTAVITGIGDIAGDIATLRVDGTQVAQNTADQGTGNFNPSGTYPLYYGARAGTSLFFNGHHYRTFGPIVRFGTNATPEQIAAAEAYYTAGLPA